jgi:hypothetical protein
MYFRPDFLRLAMTVADGSEQPASQDGDGDEPTGNTEESDATGNERREPTPQSAELRRQQYAVGVGAAIISGFALAISSLQHFPTLPESVPILAGFVGGGVVYWIVRHSLYPADGERSADE